MRLFLALCRSPTAGAPRVASPANQHIVRSAVIALSRRPSCWEQMPRKRAPSPPTARRPPRRPQPRCRGTFSRSAKRSRAPIVHGSRGAPREAAAVRRRWQRTARLWRAGQTIAAARAVSANNSGRSLRRGRNPSLPDSSPMVVVNKPAPTSFSVREGSGRGDAETDARQAGGRETVAGEATFARARP